MKSKRSTYGPKSREDLSNPYHAISHDELIKRACIEQFNDGFTIKVLKNGRIKISQ